MSNLTSYAKKTDAELLYILRDASEAALAMRGHDAVAEAKYLDQVNDASTVLHERRERSRKAGPKVEAYGRKGAASKPWRKVFASQAALERFIESDAAQDVTIDGVRDVETDSTAQQRIAIRHAAQTGEGR